MIETDLSVMLFGNRYNGTYSTNIKMNVSR